MIWYVVVYDTDSWCAFVKNKFFCRCAIVAFAIKDWYTCMLKWNGANLGFLFLFLQVLLLSLGQGAGLLTRILSLIVVRPVRIGVNFVQTWGEWEVPQNWNAILDIQIKTRKERDIEIHWTPQPLINTWTKQFCQDTSPPSSPSIASGKAVTRFAAPTPSSTTSSSCVCAKLRAWGPSVMPVTHLSGKLAGMRLVSRERATE